MEKKSVFPFKNKKIMICVTGSIAAYKAAMLVRLLIKEGAEVKVIMTPTAVEFVTPLTLATLTRNPVVIDPFQRSSGEWNNHVELGLWADLMVFAPVTANTMAKNGSRSGGQFPHYRLFVGKVPHFYRAGDGYGYVQSPLNAREY